MTRAIIAVSAIVCAACSASPDTGSTRAGTLASGTAKVTVDGKDAGTTTAVHCSTAGPLTTITTGDTQSGLTATISNKAGLVAENVTLRSLGGFTGSYNAGLGGESVVSMTGRTYTINGSAQGFRTDKPSFRADGNFAIKVSC